MSIRQKLTILMLVIGLAPTMLVGVVAYITISSSLTKKTSDQLVSTAIKQEQKINGLLQKRQEEAVGLSNKYDLQSELGHYLATNNKSIRDELASILLTKKVSTPEIQTIHLADLQGSIIASTIRTTEGSRLDAKDITLPEGQETLTTVREDPRDGIDKLYITTKVKVNKQDAALQSMIFRIDDIVAAIQDYTGLGTTGETVVVELDAKGSAISLFPLRFDTDAALKANLDSLDLFGTFPDGYKQQRDYRGNQVLVAAKSIGFADWVIATKIDRDEALSQISQLRTVMLIIFVSSSAIIAAIALYFSRFFTRPILAIAQAASEIGRGNFSARADMNRQDEIGMLANSVNSMGSSLVQYVDNIETQRTRLETILNSTTESIMAIDKQGYIIIANHATVELTQLPVDVIVGKHVSNIFAWTQNGRPFPIDYASPGAKAYADLQFVDRTSTTHFVKLIVAKVSGEKQENAAQTIITVHDETKSRELEAMKVDFVSMAAHELRTPLAAIRGYLELISFKRTGDQAAATDNYIHQALQSASELGALINNLLDVTRIERGTMTLDMEKVDLAADVKQAVQDAQFTAKDKYINLDYSGPDQDVYAMGDRIALHEVINNLITNAIKFTKSGGLVSVSLRQSAQNISVSVKDTGEGIPRAAQASLFTKFYRVKGGLNSGNNGTGLGLFISKSIIERHGGSIGFVSEEGVGSTFTFIVPVYDQAKYTALKSSQQSDIMTNRRQSGWVTQNIAR